jgi:Family of unknown function (DUF6064)
MLPFTTDEFFAVFTRYNVAIWPTQIGAAALGFVTLILLFRSEPAASRVISLILTAFWLIMGIGYHLLFFAPINRMAYAFAVLFVAQAVLLFVDGVIRRQITYRAESGWRGWPAWALIAYALVIYPLIGLAGPHPYPMTPLFGVAPCPTTIFTLGLLLLSNASWRLFAIPLVWSAIGGSAAILLAVPQDYGLIAAGVMVAALKVSAHTQPRGR